MPTSQINTVAPSGVWNSRAIAAEDIQTLRETIAHDCDNSQFRLFLATCNRTGLDPIAKQIHPVIRMTSKQVNGQWTKIPTLNIQVGIDGFRVIAQRSGKYRGQTAPQWCGEDGAWVDVWLKPTHPAAARIGILHEDFREPIWGIATYKSFAQTDSNGKPIGLWAKMADNQLLKCAEAQGLRKAFPNDLSGIYEPAEGASEPIDITPDAEGQPTTHVHTAQAPQAPTLDPELLALQRRLSQAFEDAGAPSEDADGMNAKWEADIVSGKASKAVFLALVERAEAKAEKAKQQAAPPSAPEPAAEQPADLTVVIEANWGVIREEILSRCQTKRQASETIERMKAAWGGASDAHLLEEQAAWLELPKWPWEPEVKA